MRIVLRALVLGVAVALACSDATTAPQPGTLTVTLTTPNANDAAILFRITGPNLPEFASAQSGYVLHQRSSNGTTGVAVFGALASGALATFDVPDVARAGDYSVTVLEVSDASNALRGDVSGYGLSVRR